MGTRVATLCTRLTLQHAGVVRAGREQAARLAVLGKALAAEQGRTRGAELATRALGAAERQVQHEQRSAQYVPRACLECIDKLNVRIIIANTAGTDCQAEEAAAELSAFLQQRADYDNRRNAQHASEMSRMVDEVARLQQGGATLQHAFSLERATREHSGQQWQQSADHWGAQLALSQRHAEEAQQRCEREARQREQTAYRCAWQPTCLCLTLRVEPPPRSFVRG